MAWSFGHAGVPWEAAARPASPKHQPLLICSVAGQSGESSTLHWLRQRGQSSPSWGGGKRSLGTPVSFFCARQPPRPAPTPLFPRPLLLSRRPRRLFPLSHRVATQCRRAAVLLTRWAWGPHAFWGRPPTRPCVLVWHTQRWVPHWSPSPSSPHAPLLSRFILGPALHLLPSHPRFFFQLGQLDQRA